MEQEIKDFLSQLKNRKHNFYDYEVNDYDDYLEEDDDEYEEDEF